MKNIILCFIFVVTGALLFSVTKSFSYPSYCTDPGGRNCAACHSDQSDCIVVPPSACNDNDNDGYGNPGDSSCSNGSATDCNDNNAAINPGARENCTDGIDNNCNNMVDAQDPNAFGCPVQCIDNDGDGYSIEGGECGPTDCDDNDPDVNPGAFEVCNDSGIDNDCDGQVDCDDSDCVGDVDFCSCQDYSKRTSCKGDSRCSWSGKYKTCSGDDVIAIPVVCSDFNGDQTACLDNGCRWNKRKQICR